MKIRLKYTKLVDEYKRPILFYHTSPVENIKRFYSLSHFGTQKAAQMRSIHFIYKALKISDPAALPDELPSFVQKRLSELKDPPKLWTYPVFLYIRSALKIPDFGAHTFEQYYNWFSTSYKPKSKFLTGQERLEGDAVGDARTTYKKALAKFIFIDPFMQTKENLEKELSADSLNLPSIKNEPPESIPYFLHQAKENLKKIPFDLAQKVSLGRMIRFLEGEGYDAFVYKNDYEDRGQESYITFRSEQIFSPNSMEIEHTFPPSNSILLTQIEQDFFRDKKIPSPSERRIQLLYQKKQNMR